jgi:hypothetical protein
MLVDAYKLRSEGKRRVVDAVMKTPARGELLYSVRLHDPRPGRSVYKAMLLMPEEYSYFYPCSTAHASPSSLARAFW